MMNTNTTPRSIPGSRRPIPSLLIAAAVVLTTVTIAPAMSLAVPAAPGSVFDDFEDNSAADWGFFGGSGAGGGGGTLDDRPKEGSYYFSTGWGGNGTASGFYGGAFKNLPNDAQLTLPADPWFNVWVLNQSNATVDQYNLEVTIREDTNGDGWTSGADDSFRLDTTFTSSSFDDEWTILSAPVSSFIDQFTGGDGTFNGNLDELVIVIAGVQGGVGSTVEVDFDQFTFTSGAPAAFDEVLFDDMDHGDPFGNGWFAFNGDVGGGGIGPNTADLPPALGGAFSLETGWGSGGTPGFYGGFGRTIPTDPSGTEFFNFWINPNGGQDYTLEINLQDDDNGDGAINPPDDDEFQFDCVVSATGPCAVSGGGWQLVSIPLADFFDDNSFLFGGNGVLDPTPAVTRRQRRADQRRGGRDRHRRRRQLPHRLLGVQPRPDRARDRHRHRRLRERRGAGRTVRRRARPRSASARSTAPEAAWRCPTRRPRPRRCCPQSARRTTCCRWTSTSPRSPGSSTVSATRPSTPGSRRTGRPARASRSGCTGRTPARRCSSTSSTTATPARPPTTPSA